MLHELLTPLLDAAGSRAVPWALGAAAAGLMIWAAGARISRSLFTLLGVSLGAWAGLHLPRWMGWEIDAMGPAIIGALLLGLAGYLLHTIWVCLTLASLLAAGGAFIAWHRLGGLDAWSFAAMHDATDSLFAAGEFVRSIPRPILFAAGGCFTAGALLAGFWQKLGRVIAFSLLGSVMLIAGGLIAMYVARPEWLGMIPADTQTRGIAVAALVVMGAIVQWALTPRALRPAPSAPLAPGGGASRPPRDVRDLGLSSPGPLNLKEARA